MQRRSRQLVCIWSLVFAVCVFLAMGQISPPPAGQPQKQVRTTKKKTNKQKSIPVSMVMLNKMRTAPKKPVRKTVKSANSRNNSSGSKKNNGGASPSIIATYGLPVSEYIQYMLDNGAKLTLYDQSARRLVCSVLQDGTLAGEINRNGLSKRARILTQDYPGTAAIFKRARARYGAGAYDLLLLLPSRMDDDFYGNIYETIHNLGYTEKDIISVKVKYGAAPDGIKVLIQKIETAEKTVRTNVSFLI